MMTTRRRTHGLLCVALAGSLGFGAVGCGGSGGTDAKAADTSVTADELCAVGAVNKGAAGALEVITGTTLFAPTGGESAVAAAAGELTGVAAPLGSGTGEICSIYPRPESGGPADEIRIVWRLSSTPPKEDTARKFTRLPMGEKAGAAHDSAFVTFPCSPEDKPLASPDHVSVWAQSRAMPTEAEGDVRPLKNAYATLAHSFALAMAKELKCEDGGGLKPEPSLVPAS
ncbi:hypothetical protein OG875_10505 [Streptomyces sp. NBC_01498]|uniref:hypothetical protein n=1 Tax=Streptomyces sp. NBC_01498 TaxID=2975870 RepID=UPI002E7ABBAC|nr:hypothetical protein [Streptomyces sp. NBC_01498]WTL24990.1 hypothetical protein OG875_10505 [Streptomyces sp. NBC_01498]